MYESLTGVAGAGRGRGSVVNRARAARGALGWDGYGESRRAQRTTTTILPEIIAVQRSHPSCLNLATASIRYSCRQ